MSSTDPTVTWPPLRLPTRDWTNSSSLCHWGRSGESPICRWLVVRRAASSIKMCPPELLHVWSMSKLMHRTYTAITSFSKICDNHVSGIFYPNLLRLLCQFSTPTMQFIMCHFRWSLQKKLTIHIRSYCCMQCSHCSEKPKGSNCLLVVWQYIHLYVVLYHVPSRFITNTMNTTFDHRRIKTAMWKLSKLLSS